MGYLGKISAIVSANTSDFSAKLAASGKEIQSWARSLNSAVNSASSKASSSLRGIYTEAQKAERALQAIQAKKIDFKGFEGAKDLGAAVGRMQALISVTKGVNEPLNKVARTIEKLPIEMQGGFNQALQKAQVQAERLAASVSLIGTGRAASDDSLARRFEKAQRVVQKTLDAVERLKAASAGTAALSTGADFRFRRPEFSQELGRAGGLQETAADTRGANFSDLISRQKVAAEATAIALSKMENAQLTFRGDVKGATAEYQRQLAVLKQINDEIEKSIAAASAGGAAKKARQDVAFAVTGKPQNMNQAEQAYSRLIGQVQQLSAEQRKAFAPNLRALGSLVAAGDEASLKDIRRLIAEIDKDLAKQKSLDIATEAAKKKLDDIKSRLRGVSDALAGRSSDPFAQMEASANKARQAVDRVKDAKRKAMLDSRLTRVQGQVDADLNAGLSPAQLARRARTRTSQLDRIAATADTQTSSDIFGAMPRSRGDRIDSLKGQISSAQAAIAELPGPLQAKLLPALRSAREAFAKLTPSSTAAEIRAAARAAADLEKNTKRAADASKFRGNFGQFLREGAADRFSSQLKTIQTQLLSVGVTARGPVAAAVNQYQKALEKAAEKGTLGTERTKKKMDALVASIAKAAVASGKFTEAQAKVFIANAKGAFARGDVGRMGADKAGLAFQQLGFAIDDFMSATGGVDQKIRAVSNNISQLAFIVGGTKGLFIALGVTMAAQAALMASKWAAGGKTAEDQTKALNDSLAKQKSLLESLRQAFDSFADSLGRNTFSKQAADAEEYRRQIDEISKKQKERRDARLVDLSPEVQRERGEQNRIDRELEGATDMGQRAALLAQKAASERREKDAAARAAAAPAPGQPDIERVMLGTIRANEFLEGGRMTARSERVAEERRQKAREDVAAAGTAEKQAAVVRERISEREAMAARPIDVMSVFSGEATEIMRAREDVAALEILLAQLEETIRDGGNALAIGVLEGSVRVAQSLEAAQQLLDATLIPFSKTRAEADKAAAQLQKVVEELKTAEAPDRIAELEKQRAALEQQSAQYRSAAEVIRTFADTVKRISTDLANAVEGESRSAADQARRDSNRADAAADVGGDFGPNGVRRRPGEAIIDRDRARRRRDDAEKEARRAQDDADQVREENDGRRRRFEEGLVNDPVVQGERKRMQELQATIDSDTATMDEKSEAAAEQNRIRRRQERRFEDSPEGRASRDRANLADRRAARQQEWFRQEDEEFRAAQRGRDEIETPAQREERRVAEREKDIRSGARQFGLPAAERDRAIRNARVEESERRRQEEKSIRDADPRERGRRLGMTDREQFRQDALDGVGYDGAMRRAQIQAEGGNVDAFIKQFTANQMEQVAPMLAQFQQERETAIAGGPSRAALTASDVTTSQGMSELNRLLRGDDASKDVNLAELQKQTDRLTELVDIVKNNPVPVL